MSKKSNQDELWNREALYNLFINLTSFAKYPEVISGIAGKAHA